VIVDHDCFDVPVDSEAAVVILSILSRVQIAPRDRVCACVHRDECACVVSISAILCNPKKNPKLKPNGVLFCNKRLSRQN
jgi:hypothetical protein